MRKELERDRGLARLGRSTRWITAGAFLSAGCLSVAVAETLPGRSSAATPSTHTQSTQTQAPQTQPTQTQAPQTLAPPTTPPTTAYTPPMVVSGGS